MYPSILFARKYCGFSDHDIALERRSRQANHSLSTSASITTPPPNKTAELGTSLTNTHANRMPKMISSKASKDISGALSTRAHMTAKEQGIANWAKPKKANHVTSEALADQGSANGRVNPADSTAPIITAGTKSMD
jgi:hypothetical protein